LQYSADRGSGPYEAMRRRCEEILISENRKRMNKDKLRDRIIGFVLGVIATVIASLIKEYFSK